MARPWRWQALSDVLQDDGPSMGRSALRLIRRHRAMNIQGGITIAINDEGLDWLKGDGADALNVLSADLAFSPEFRSDNTRATAVVDEPA